MTGHSTPTMRTATWLAAPFDLLSTPISLCAAVVESSGSRDNLQAKKEKKKKRDDEVTKALKVAFVEGRLDLRAKSVRKVAGCHLVGSYKPCTVLLCLGISVISLYFLRSLIKRRVEVNSLARQSDPSNNVSHFLLVFLDQRT